MQKKAGLLVRTTFALPVLSCSLATEAGVDQSPASENGKPAVVLGDEVLDQVTAGREALVLPELPDLSSLFPNRPEIPSAAPELPSLPSLKPPVDPPVVTTLAVGEEGGQYPIPGFPVVTPVPMPPIATTLAVGEEGGGWGF